uniref:Superoxide dismutase copper/zinc binding domain-containing protein n=1 Tax=Acanthochromis polyacanthus TaxID=80966 RepID=A0A3Q1GDM1_9TELE
MTGISKRCCLSPTDHTTINKCFLLSVFLFLSCEWPQLGQTKSTHPGCLISSLLRPHLHTRATVTLLVSAILNMRGIRGYVSFRQASPFDVTELRVNLTNLQSRVGPYHVHKFPVPLVGTNSSSLCSNDNVGLNASEMVFTDFSLPLFGQNSIVGRSVVIHLTDGARYVCASIGNHYARTKCITIGGMLTVQILHFILWCAASISH